MSKAKKKRDGRIRRHNRLRRKIEGTSGRPRLAVFRSNKNISAQIIDDVSGKTIASASTLEAELRGSGAATVDGASKVGTLVAERARAAGIEAVVFDRGGVQYHGRVAAVADAAREAGLKF